jgi:hypothetical protein
MNSTELVNKRIKPHLDYDSVLEEYRTVPKLSEIVATHGASIAAIGRLARDGKFTGGSTDAGIAGQFFTTPNKHYSGWQNNDVFPDVSHTAAAYPGDAFLVGIEYADYPEAEDLEAEYVGGVVIGFNKKILVPGISLHEDIKTQKLELILPEAPSMHTIAGIYPIDADSAEELHALLEI